MWIMSNICIKPLLMVLYVWGGRRFNSQWDTTVCNAKFSDAVAFTDNDTILTQNAAIKKKKGMIIKKISQNNWSKQF